jgi:hypothetical protein
MVGIIASINRFEFVTGRIESADIIAPLVLTTAVVIRFLKTRAELLDGISRPLLRLPHRHQRLLLKRIGDAELLDNLLNRALRIRHYYRADVFCGAPAQPHDEPPDFLLRGHSTLRHCSSVYGSPGSPRRAPPLPPRFESSAGPRPICTGVPYIWLQPAGFQLRLVGLDRGRPVGLPLVHHPHPCVAREKAL